MIKVDWSKAPNWATHAGIIDASLTGGLDSCIVWYNAEQFCRMSDDRQRAFMWSDPQVARARYNPKESQVRFFEERPECWNSEGLPPVGTACEWFDPSCDRWLSISIAYLSSWVVVIRDEKPHPDGSVEIGLALSTDPEKQPKFRAVRTPEQIAAEEREAAINTMCDLLGTPRGTVAAGVVMRLYDAGCRMQVTE